MRSRDQYFISLRVVIQPPKPRERYLCCFQFEVITNKTCRNIHLQIFLGEFKFYFLQGTYSDNFWAIV